VAGVIEENFQAVFLKKFKFELWYFSPRTVLFSARNLDSRTSKRKLWSVVSENDVLWTAF